MRWALVAGDRRRTWKDVRAASESIAADKRLFYEVNLPFATAGPSPTAAHLIGNSPRFRTGIGRSPNRNNGPINLL